MRRLKPIAGIVIVFILGVLAGIFAARFFAILESGHPRRRSGPEQRAEFIMKRLTRDLELSNSQQSDVRQIVIATEEKVQLIKDEYAPVLKSLYDKSIEEIKTRLTPEQQAELDRIHDRWKRRQRDKGQPSSEKPD